MHIDELITYIKKTIPEYLDKPGESLYSAASTLSKGDIYLLGTNPGGQKPNTLKEDLENLRTKKDNEYTDAIWKTKSNPNVEAGKDTLQIRIKELIEKSTNSNIENICASNLIFSTSIDISSLKKDFGMSFNKIALKYWGIHQKILKVVQPKVIIVFGNSESDSPYAFLKKYFIDSLSNEDFQTTGWGREKAKSFEFTLHNNKCHVVGLPHLSRFAIKDEKVFAWIKNKVKS